ETPPGHWFTILNYVNDHPLFEKKFEGSGEVLDDLEWDVKSYFILGGALHDVAVAVWGIKSFYDYIRPISAIRGMAELGQSSDSTMASYHIGGLPLIEGYIELVESGDPLAGAADENVGKIKLYAWRGPAHLTSDSSSAGVGWILAGDWWPYQMPSFITPPFAGYVSGHSTFSRAAAEVMTLLTGDAYFPGGMGTFDANKNEYLVFEEGPSVDMQLQWATYRDASDQASLSRLWGGIHPPVDDIPGRKIGKVIGPEAFEYAKTFFSGQSTATIDQEKAYEEVGVITNWPNPIRNETTFAYTVRNEGVVQINIFDLTGKEVKSINEGYRRPGVYESTWSTAGEILGSGMYFYRLQLDGKSSAPKKMMSISGN
ncbi:MAG: T9SS type A sorting domain-containing protein, partial [Saprospiraceae bacterium]|nr:T9SS type A sorting domain-containing protein [Saprospiraceae bacterium]